jgi:hypothetical protein
MLQCKEYLKTRFQRYSNGKISVNALKEPTLNVLNLPSLEVQYLNLHRLSLDIFDQALCKYESNFWSSKTEVKFFILSPDKYRSEAKLQLRTEVVIMCWLVAPQGW